MGSRLHRAASCSTWQVGNEMTNDRLNLSRGAGILVRNETKYFVGRAIRSHPCSGPDCEEGISGRINEINEKP